MLRISGVPLSAVSRFRYPGGPKTGKRETASSRNAPCESNLRRLCKWSEKKRAAAAGLPENAFTVIEGLRPRSLRHCDRIRHFSHQFLCSRSEHKSRSQEISSAARE